MIVRPAVLGGEQLGEGVVHVEDHRRPAQARQQRRGGEDVGHVVNLDQVIASMSVERAQTPQRARQELGVSANVGAPAALGLARAEGMGAYRALADAHRFALADAQKIDFVAALGQGPGLALDARVETEIGQVHHRHA